jgi:hypothetical protein
VERAREAPCLAALALLDHHAAATAGVDERAERTAAVAGREDRDGEIVGGQQRAPLGQVAAQTDQLGMVAEELLALAAGDLGVDVDRRGVPEQSTGVDVGARVEARHERLDLCHLLGVLHVPTVRPDALQHETGLRWRVAFLW